MDPNPNQGELLEYESPREWEEFAVEPSAVLSLVALVAMVAIPLSVLVFLLLVW